MEFYSGKKNLAAREARRYEGRIRGIIARNKKIALGRLFNKALKKAKYESWQSFVSNMESTRGVASLLKSLGKKEPNQMPLLRKDENSWASNARENLEILRNSHFTNSYTTFDRNEGNDIYFDDSLPNTIDAFLSWELFKKAVDELPSGKAPGPDGIKNEVIKRLPDRYLKELLTPM